MSTIHNWHPAAAAFPMLQADEFQQFVEDIKANEVRKPIEVYDGERFPDYKGHGIDGRNRHAACLSLGIEPPLKMLTDADLGASQSLTAYIVTVNVARRHLTSSQAATVGVEIKRQLEAEAHQRQVAHLRRGNDGPVPELIPEREPAENAGKNHANESREKAAAIVGTNGRYISDAEKLEAAAPSLLAAVRTGALTITQARSALKLRAKAPEAFAALEEGRIGFVEFRAACQEEKPAPAAMNAAPATEPERQGPGELDPVFAEVPKMLAFGTSLGQLLDAAKGWDDAPAASQMDTCGLFLRLQEALRIVAEGMPFDDCPRCTASPEQGNGGPATCPLCRNTKFITVKVHERLMQTIEQLDAENKLPVPEASPCETWNLQCEGGEAAVV